MPRPWMASGKIYKIWLSVTILDQVNAYTYSKKHFCVVDTLQSRLLGSADLTTDHNCLKV